MPRLTTFLLAAAATLTVAAPASAEIIPQQSIAGVSSRPTATASAA
jgi:hypothetical protein